MDPRLTSCMVDGDTFMGSFFTGRRVIVVNYKGASKTAPLGVEREQVTARGLLSMLVREDLGLHRTGPGIAALQIGEPMPA